MTGASLPKVPFEQEIEVGEGVSHTGTRGWVFQAAGHSVHMRGRLDEGQGSQVNGAAGGRGVMGLRWLGPAQG